MSAFMDRWTVSSQDAAIIGQRIAHELDHDRFDEGHLLLGLFLAYDSLAGDALRALGVTEEGIRHELNLLVLPTKDPPRGGLLVTEGVKDALVIANMGTWFRRPPDIGTDDLLLGLTADPSNQAMRILARLGVSDAQIRSQVHLTRALPSSST